MQDSDREVDRIERLRKRLHMLQTKEGTLNVGEREWMFQIEDELTKPSEGLK